RPRGRGAQRARRRTGGERMSDTSRPKPAKGRPRQPTGPTQPDHPWVKCGGCQEILFRKEIERKLNVCAKCGYHLRLTVEQRVMVLVDRGSFEELDAELTAADPLGFQDTVAYPDRVEAARAKTGRAEALISGFATFEGRRAAVGIFDFNFL